MLFVGWRMNIPRKYFYYLALLILGGVVCSAYFAPRTEAQVGRPIYCTASAYYDAADNGSVQLVAAPSQITGAIYVCSYAVMVGLNSANVGLTFGTGANCAVGNTKITPAWQLGANGGIAEVISNYSGLSLPIGKALCVTSSLGVSHQARVSYAIVF